MMDNYELYNKLSLKKNPLKITVLPIILLFRYFFRSFPANGFKVSK